MFSGQLFVILAMFYYSGLVDVKGNLSSKISIPGLRTPPAGVGLVRRRRDRCTAASTRPTSQHPRLSLSIRTELNNVLYFVFLTQLHVPTHPEVAVGQAEVNVALGIHRGPLAPRPVLRPHRAGVAPQHFNVKLWHVCSTAELARSRISEFQAVVFHVFLYFCEISLANAV